MHTLAPSRGCNKHKKNCSNQRIQGLCSGPKLSPSRKKLLKTGMFENGSSNKFFYQSSLRLYLVATFPSLSPNLVPSRSSAHGKSDLTTCWKWGGRRFRVILFRRRTRVSIPCKEMIGVKRFPPVLIYRQISRDCILNQQPHWIVYHFLAGSLSSKI